MIERVDVEGMSKDGKEDRGRKREKEKYSLENDPHTQLLHCKTLKPKQGFTN